MDNQHDIKLWINKCRNNDRHYQERLYRFYFDDLHRQVKYYTSDAQEQITIINDTFLKAFKNIDKFRFEGSFEGWLRKILYFTMIDMKRANKSRFNYELETYHDAQKPHSLDELYCEDIHNYIDELPQATREVFTKFAIEGFKHREIAKIFGITVGTSKWHVHQAREMISNAMLMESKRLK